MAFKSLARRPACLPLLAAAILGTAAPARGADLYVKTAAAGGDDANTGADPAHSKASIQAAIEAAYSGALAPCTIQVADGVYQVDSDAAVATNVVLRNGISLKGGWDQAFGSWNPALHVTTLRDVAATGGTDATPSCALLAGPADPPVTEGTIVEGFTIEGATGGYSAAVVTTGSAAPTLRGNVLVGGASATRSIGIQLASPARVIGNRIRGQSGDYSMGVRIVGASPLVASNVIEGGSGTAASWGVTAFGSAAPVIAGNTIDGGSGSEASVAIHVGLSATATVDGNIVFTASSPVRVCVYKDGDAGSLEELSNNDLFSCPTALVARYAGLSAPYEPTAIGFVSVADVNDAATLGFVAASGGNVSAVPGFASAPGGDYHLTAASPAAVTQGGLDLSSTFAVDADGATRTAPWSIGAYEYDAPADPGGSGDVPTTPAPAEEDILACSHFPPGAGVALGVLALLLTGRRARRRAVPALLVLLLGAGTARAATERVMVLPLKAGAGISSQVAEAVSDAFVAGIQQRGGAVLGARDLEAALGFEKQKQMLGCSEDTSCLAEIGGAMGAGRIVYGSIARVGETLTFSAQLFDVKRATVLVRFHRRLPGAGEQALLDVADDAAEELFPGQGGEHAGAVSSRARPAAAPAGLYALLAGASSTRSAGGLFGAGVGYRFGDHLGAELRALYTGGGWVGGGARVTAAIGGWRLRPFVALDAELLGSDRSALALGGEVGLELRLSPRVRLSAGVPLLYLASTPARTEPAYLLVGGGASVDL